MNSHQGSPSPDLHPLAQSDLERRLLVRNWVLEVAYSLGRAVASELQIEPLCDEVTRHLIAVFQAEAITLYFLDESSGELFVKRRLEAGPSGTESTDSETKFDVAHQAVRERKLICIHSSASVEKPSTEAPNIGNGTVVAVPLQQDQSPKEIMGQSSAAVPLIAESRVKGVVEMTWAKDSGRPTDDDLHLIEILSTQISAAIDNAWLYGEMRSFNQALEEKVRTRTIQLDQRNREISSALDELKLTQSQLVQNEKMASLGQLTAGVAHEINNPLSYSVSNLAIISERLTSLELRTRVYAALAEAATTRDPTEILSIVNKFAELLQDHPRYHEDLRLFQADLRDLEPKSASELSQRFLQYVIAGEDQEMPLSQFTSGLSDLVARTSRGLERVKNIVLDLRTFARLDEAQYQTVNLDDSVASAVSIVRHLAKDRGIELTHVRGMTQAYSCFSAKLSQVVLNLLTNAIQATPADGRVEVLTRESEKGPVIEVKDNGCGIPAENLHRVLDPFFTTKPVGEGTGLGLSISYGIVKDHGGELQVESKPGHGSVFRIQLPLAGERKKSV